MKTIVDAGSTEVMVVKIVWSNPLAVEMMVSKTVDGGTVVVITSAEPDTNSVVVSVDA